MKNANHLTVALTVSMFTLTASIALADATESTAGGRGRDASRPTAIQIDATHTEDFSATNAEGGAPAHDRAILAEMQDRDLSELPPVEERELKPTVPAPKPGDINGDGRVNVDDLLLLMQDWGTCNGGEKLLSDIAPQGGNCIVDVDDLLIVIDNWES